MDGWNHAKIVDPSNSSEDMTIIDACMLIKASALESQQTIDENDLTPKSSTNSDRKSDLASLWITKESYNQFVSKRKSIKQEKGNSITEKNDKCSCAIF